MLPWSSRHLPWWKPAVSWLKRWCHFYFYNSWAKTFIIICPVGWFCNMFTESLNVKTKTYHCKQIKMSAFLITMHSSNVSNKSICALSRAPAIFHVQIKFRAATHCRANALMWVSSSRWWTATNRFLSSEFEIAIVCTPLHYQIIIYITR